LCGIPANAAAKALRHCITGISPDLFITL